MSIPPEGSCLIGKNGHGKTNVLEAIYYLSTLKSFRTNKDFELIQTGEDFFRLEGKYTGLGGRGTIEAAYDGKKKFVRVNGRKPEKIAEAFGKLKTVVITPEDAEMIRAYPAKRRKFMDIVISMTSKKYLYTLTRYQSVLRHRNALLKECRKDSMEAWDAQLAEIASEIAIMRYEFMEEYACYYEETQKKLAGGNESSVSYLTSPREAGLKIETGDRAITGLYEEFLDRNYERDKEIGTTTTGPHRDDIVIRLGGKGMKVYGSQGQQRTSIFALRIAEARYVEEKTGERPVILLDDVFGQIDADRGRYLMDLVYGTYQTIITSHMEEAAHYTPVAMSRVRVRGGELAIEKS